MNNIRAKKFDVNLLNIIILYFLLKSNETQTDLIRYTVVLRKHGTAKL